jgi:hypothetical protein
VAALIDFEASTLEAGPFCSAIRCCHLSPDGSLRVVESFLELFGHRFILFRVGRDLSPHREPARAWADQRKRHVNHWKSE